MERTSLSDGLERATIGTVKSVTNVEFKERQLSVLGHCEALEALLTFLGLV